MEEQASAKSDTQIETQIQVSSFLFPLKHPEMTSNGSYSVLTYPVTSFTPAPPFDSGGIGILTVTQKNKDCLVKTAFIYMIFHLAVLCSTALVLLIFTVTK